MQPKPMADTSRLLFPSLRVCIYIPLFRTALVTRLSQSNGRTA